MENIHLKTTTLSRLYNAIEEIYHPQDELTPKETFEQKTIKLIKEQQDLGKITIKDSTDMLAQSAGLKSINKKIDDKILTSALYDLKRLRRLALKEKLERPLKLKSPLKEKELNKNSSPQKLKKLIKQKQ